MEKKKVTVFAVLGVVAVAIVIAAFAIFSPNGHVVKQPVSSGPASSGSLFSNSPLYKYAYQIFPGPISSTAKKAMNGFTLQEKNNSDGSTTINLVAVNPEYQSQTYNVKPGDKVYYIERTFGDDAGSEHFLADDMAVVVNPQGDILQGPAQA